MPHQPIMLFSSRHDSDLVARIAAINPEQEVPITRIDSDQKAKQMRTLYAKRTHGIFLVSRRFATGFDLRVARDIHVIVIIEDTSFRSSELA